MFRWDRAAVAVPPEGRTERFLLGAWVCVMCGMLADWAAWWGVDEAGEYHGCGGRVAAAAGGQFLGGGA